MPWSANCVCFQGLFPKSTVFPETRVGKVVGRSYGILQKDLPPLVFRSPKAAISSAPTGSSAPLRRGLHPCKHLGAQFPPGRLNPSTFTRRKGTGAQFFKYKDARSTLSTGVPLIASLEIALSYWFQDSVESCFSDHHQPFPYLQYSSSCAAKYQQQTKLTF